jgi:hypothetical protein
VGIASISAVNHEKSSLWRFWLQFIILCKNLIPRSEEVYWSEENGAREVGTGGQTSDSHTFCIVITGGVFECLAENETLFESGVKQQIDSRIQKVFDFLLSTGSQM